MRFLFYLLRHTCSFLVTLVYPAKCNQDSYSPLFLLRTLHIVSPSSHYSLLSLPGTIDFSKSHRSRFLGRRKGSLERFVEAPEMYAVHNCTLCALQSILILVRDPQWFARYRPCLRFPYPSFLLYAE